jgi:hypothetical protein
MLLNLAVYVPTDFCWTASGQNISSHANIDRAGPKSVFRRLMSSTS